MKILEYVFGYATFAYLFVAIGGAAISAAFERTPKQARNGIRDSILWPIIMVKTIINRIRWILSKEEEKIPEENDLDFYSPYRNFSSKKKK